MKQETKCIQVGYEPKSGDPRVLPLMQSTTYFYETAEELAHLFDVPKDGHIYSRISNPTVSALETKIAALEGGSGAMATSSGMSATMLAILTVCSKGDNIVASSKIYGGSFNLFKVTLPRLGITTKFFEPEDSSEKIASLIDENTKCVFGETVANPAMSIFDTERIAKICKEKGVVLIVDNTLATPVLARPFEFGANVVVHSTSKYLDGHASCVGGMVVDGGNFEYVGNPRYKDFYTPDESYHGTVYTEEGGACAFVLKARMQYMRDMGVCMSPFNAYLTNLGIETLHLRMQRHSENALAVAEFLDKNPDIAWVKYGGLKNDKNHELAKKYFKGGYSGMVVIGLADTVSPADFIKNLKLIKQVTHIADVRSCALHPASTTHRQLSESDLVACGVPSNMVRLSIGIEAIDDIIEDIRQALEKAKK